MAGVDAVADRLADEMRAERPAAEAVLLEEAALLATVRLVRERAIDLEVVAPAGELQPVEAPGATPLGEIRERQVGPLAGEQGDGTGHGSPPRTRGGQSRTYSLRRRQRARFRTPRQGDRLGSRVCGRRPHPAPVVSERLLVTGVLGCLGAWVAQGRRSTTAMRSSATTSGRTTLA